MPVKLWHTTLDAPIVKVSWHTISKNRKKIFPVKSILTKKSVYLLSDNASATKREIPEHYESITISDNGSLMAGFKKNSIDLFTTDYQVLKHIQLNEAPSFLLSEHLSYSLSPDGLYIVIVSWFLKHIYIYDASGNLLAKHAISDLRGARVKFSKNGNYLLIHVPNWGTGNTHGYILYMDRKGKILWHKDHDGCQAQFDISYSGHHAVMFSEGTICAMNHQGEVIYEHKTDIDIFNIALSGNAKFLLMSQSKQPMLSCINNDNGALLWTHNLENVNSSSQFTISLDVPHNGNFYIACISKDWNNKINNNQCYIFNPEGKKIWQNSYNHSQLFVQLSDCGKFFVLIGDNQIYLYRI